MVGKSCYEGIGVFGRSDTFPIGGIRMLSGPMRVALIDDDNNAHVALRQIFSAFAPSWRLQSYLDAGHAISTVPAENPDAVLMDLSTSDARGFEYTRKLKAFSPELPVVMLAERADAQGIALALRAGANGYLIKPAPVETLLQALTRVSTNVTVLCRQSCELLMASLSNLSDVSKPLTAREEQALAGLLRKMTNKEIAYELGIAEGTVRIHIEHLFRKLEVHSRAEARAKARWLKLGQ